MKSEKAEWSFLIARLILGSLMLAHGIYKFQYMEFFVGAFSTWWGLPGFLAYIVAVIEALGGLFIILGLWVKVFSFAFGVIMVGAILTVKLNVGIFGDGQAGYELDLTYLALAILLGVNGSSKWSLSHLIVSRKI